MYPTVATCGALPPKVLHRVREIELMPVEASLGQRAVEDTAGWPDERFTLPIFDVAGLLADHHHPGRPLASAEDHLSRPGIKVAAFAASGGRGEYAELRARRHERLRSEVANHDRGLPGSRAGQTMPMPELPDVEGFRRALAEGLTGRRVVGVTVLDPGVLRNRTPSQFVRQLTGRRFVEPARSGKWLILPTDGSTLLIHNGMTGRPYLADPGEEPDRYDRLVITTDDHQLRYSDLRKLRGIWLAATDLEVADVIGPQGQDAGRMSDTDFIEAFRPRRGQLKPTLMDQTVIAGIGNMLSDEVCWRAYLHPASSIPELSDDELRRLARQLHQVLRAAIRAGHIPRTRSWLNSRRDRPDPAPCPRCGTTICRTRIGGRTSLWCPRCQPGLGQPRPA